MKHSRIRPANEYAHMHVLVSKQPREIKSIRYDGEWVIWLCCVRERERMWHAVLGCKIVSGVVVWSLLPRRRLSGIWMIAVWPSDDIVCLLKCTKLH